MAGHHARHLPGIANRSSKNSPPAKIRTLNRPSTTGWRTDSAAPSARPAFPPAAAGKRTGDGRLWFPTSRGLAVLDPDARNRDVLPPLVNLVEMVADGHREVDLRPAVDTAARQRPGADPLHRDSSQRAGARAVFLQAGGVGCRVDAARDAPRDQLQQPAAGASYRFVVRAELAGGPASERIVRLRIAAAFLPDHLVPLSVRCALLAAGWAVYQLRLQQIRSRFALVLAERARLAREIHDTLAQGFVGISSQLDAVAMCMTPSRPNGPARSSIWRARWRGTASPKRGVP